MNAAARRLSLTLALHPHPRGFGWVAFEGPFSLFDWGVASTDSRNKHEFCLSRIERLLSRLGPECLVLEAFEEGDSRRAERIARLCRAILSLAANRSVSVAVYSRGDVRACFASVGARTREEIAASVARHLEPLRDRLPPKRRAWTKETLPLAMFSAAALGLTHYQLGSLFEQL